jgi:hypothetical protein
MSSPPVRKALRMRLARPLTTAPALPALSVVLALGCLGAVAVAPAAAAGTTTDATASTAATAVPKVAASARSTMAAKPAPHPVPPKIQTLEPRGVDQGALTQLKAGTAQSRAAARPDLAAGSDPAAPAVVIAPTTTQRFQLVGLTWDAAAAPSGVDISVRVHEPQGWAEWHTLGVEDAGPDANTAEGRAAAATAGSDPLLTDGADGVQVVVHTSTGRAPAGLKVDLIDAGTSAADGEPATPAVPVSTAPAAQATATSAGTTTETAAVKAAVAKALPAVKAPAGGASPARVVAQPAIITRAQWGADESIRKTVDFDSTVKAMVIHHTDTTNSYHSLAQAEQQVRAVYAFHVKGRHWSDIGYNFVVDRFGHIFEGRAGSITKAVHGAHTGGFNTDTIGVAALGTFTTPKPPAKMVSAIARVVAWKMGQYSIHIGGKVTLTSAGGGTDRYKAGKKITVNTLTGHRTFGRTACPGNALWDKLSSIRKQAAKIKDKRSAATGYWPVTGVWTAGGGVQPGWFRNGVWTLRKPNGSKLTVSFGAAGDTPVVGDWNNDGVTTIGVYRGAGHWLLTNELTAKPPTDQSFTFGETGDLPVVGLWPGKAQLGIGVVRNNIWTLRASVSAGSAFTSFTYGRIGDLPMAADWDGDGFSTIGFLRGGTTWLLKAHTLSGVTTNTFTYGVPGADPSVADWNGDGTVTTSTVRSTTWYVRNDIKGGRHTSLVTFSP